MAMPMSMPLGHFRAWYQTGLLYYPHCISSIRLAARPIRVIRGTGAKLLAIVNLESEVCPTRSVYQLGPG
ncbi:hypothetical protein PAXRUDRAFT_824276 [Paxillus rubicundulus Ve08.2h10]|uniref:Uncharacterized protein n=1 Tax=Paxillus rubicundulus Ve08.2h10 TaxID=930991 RepID=A0A0D0E296_9AGAM|nr:hypothetical protein PAXRUDRAFT_824276 [Paxillus rubicundulus Ve08.2h10]